MLILSGGGVFSSFSSAVGLAVLGLFSLAQNSSSPEEVQALFSLATTFGLIALLLLPSMVMAAIRLLGKPVPNLNFPWFRRVSVLGFSLVPVLILVGFLIMQFPMVAVFILPWFQLAVVALPIWWLLETGRQGLPPYTSERGWGIFSISVTLTMPFIIFVEMILVGAIITGIIVFINLTYPDIVQQLIKTLERLGNSPMDREAILRIIRPYLNEPVIIFSLIAITAGAIPLLEELLKPMALWFLAGKELSPHEGFIGGMICGAAFALLESLGALGNPGTNSWAIVAIGRIGTGILHIAASGLVGWGMANAWTKGRYGRLAAAYLIAVGYHAVWNTTALVAGLKELAQFSPILIKQFEGFMLVSPGILGLLALGMIAWVFKANQELRRDIDV